MPGMANKTDKEKLAAGAAAIKAAQKLQRKDKAAAGSKPALQVHPAASMFPGLPAKEMRELKADIEANGIRVPLLVNRAKDTILDGRNRYLVALELGMQDIPLETFKGKEEDIPAVVLSRNVFRRHLTPDQRVAMIAKVRAPQLEKEAADRKATKGTFGAPKAADSAKGSVAKHLAEAAEVTVGKAEQALKARRAGQLQDVIDKKKTLRAAAKDAPKSGRKPRKTKAQKLAEKPFEEQVWEKWDAFIKAKFTVQQRRQVKEIIYGFLIEELGANKQK